MLNKDDTEWREGNASLPPGLYTSWDGSLHPNQFMDYCESGEALLTPTDKNYKVYIEVEVDEGKDQLQLVSYTTGKNPGASPVYGEYVQAKDVDWDTVERTGWRDIDPKAWVQLAPIGSTRRGKFYFEHLSEDQKKRFVELYNEKKLRLKFPGHFYRMPFFIK